MMINVKSVQVIVIVLEAMKSGHILAIGGQKTRQIK